MQPERDPPSVKLNPHPDHTQPTGLSEQIVKFQVFRENMVSTLFGRVGVVRCSSTPVTT